MDRQEFLESVLGDEGYYCLLGLKEKPEEERANENDKTVSVKKFYKKIEQLSRAADDFCENGYNSYFALGTYRDPKKPKTQANVEQMRSLFVDIDYGSMHGSTCNYETAQDALTDLRRFCRDTDMPKPHVIHSGGGLHVYWPLSEPVDKEEWYPLASQLKKLCIDYDLYCDPAVTSDSARVLRVPDTLNFKGGLERKVELLTKGKPHAAHFYRKIVGEPLNKMANKFDGELNEVAKAILGNRSSSFKQILDRTVKGTGCEQIGYLYAHQDECSEPMWRAAISITNYCEDREKANVRISKDHPSYSEAKLQEKVDGLKGPFTCDVIRSVMSEARRAKVCDNCPHWGKIKSPIVLGKYTKEATEEDNVIVLEDKAEDAVDDTTFQFQIPKYPRPYFRPKNGGVYKYVEKDGEEVAVPIYHNDFYVFKRLNDKALGECLVLRVHLPKDGMREFTLPMAVIASNDEFKKQLYAKGVTVAKMDEIKNYILASVNEMQFKSTAAEAHRQFGWTDSTCTVFVLGDKEIHADRIEFNPPAQTTEHLFPAFAKHGDFEAWRSAMEFYNRPGMELHQFAIGVSLGSIFTQFTAVNAAIFHMYSPDSGLGKTTALHAGATVWGNPAKLLLKDTDTTNSKMLRAETIKNLPLFLDEVTNALPKDVSYLAYSITSGEQRNRMDASSNKERVRGEPWKLMGMSTGNTSLVEKLMVYKAMPKGELMRILDVRVHKVPGLQKTETDKLSMILLNNYGHIAVPYVQHIIQNIDQYREIYGDLQRSIDKRLNFSYQHRFYSVLITNAMLGLDIAKRLGFLSFEPKPIMRWLKSVIHGVHEIADSLAMDPQQIIDEFYNDYFSNVLTIKSSHDLRKKVMEDDNTFVVAEATPKGKLVMRHEYDLQMLYIRPSVLRAWCSEKQISYGELLENLKMEPTQAKMVKKRLEKGTRGPQTSVWALEVKCSWLPDGPQETEAA